MMQLQTKSHRVFRPLSHRFKYNDNEQYKKKAREQKRKRAMKNIKINQTISKITKRPETTGLTSNLASVAKL